MKPIVTTLPIDGDLDAEATNWQQATRMGFLLPRANDETLRQWWQAVQQDGTRLRAVMPTGPGRFGTNFPIATLSSTTSTINVGGPVKPDHPETLAEASFITDVTVRPTHRRRGLLRAIISHELTDARDRGLAFATLTASEGGIYRRFGFGVATRYRQVEVDTDARFQLRHPVQGSVDLAAPADLQAERELVFAAFHANHRGSHARAALHRSYFDGSWHLEQQLTEPDLRGAVHLAPEGSPDGVLGYQVDADNGLIKVRELVFASPQAELGLWQFLADIDLTPRVRLRNLSPQSPLTWALSDPRVVTMSRSSDMTWLRILDVPLALSRRGWDHDGGMVIRVHDDLGFAEGSWRLEVSAGRAEVTPSSAPADLELDVAALGSLYFGLVAPHVLATAGDISAGTEALRRADDLFSVNHAPLNLTEF